MPADRPAERLDRAIGPWTLGANAVNLSLGAGIFALPAAVAAILGPAAIAAYLVCALAISLVLACFAELGSHAERSGGAVAYVEEAFGEAAGFATWVVFSIVYCVAADAAIANVLVDAVSTIVPAVARGVPRAAALAVLFAGLAAINVIGVRQGARLAVTTTIAKLAPLAIILVAGALAMNIHELRWQEWPPLARVGEASLLLFFTFAGAECALTPGGEVRDPARTVPRAILGGVAVLSALYIGVQAVTQGVLGAEIVEYAGAPLAAVADRLFGSAGSGLIVLCTVLATLGLLSGDLLASPRAFLPMAERGLLPRRLASVHARFRTPHVAILTYAALAFALALSGGFRPLAIMSSIALLVVYFAVCLATLKLRGRRPAGEPGFTVPGGPIVPALGMIVVGWLLLQSTWAEAGAMGITLAAAIIYPVAWQAARRRRGASAA